MYLSYKDFMNVIKYYNEDFKEIDDKTKAHWLLDIETVNKDIKIHKLYELSTDKVEEYMTYKEHRIGADYYYNKDDIIFENALVNGYDTGMVVRKDYGILEIYAIGENGNSEGMSKSYSFNNKKIQENLWYKDELITGYYNYKNGNIAEKTLADGEIETVKQYYPTGELYVKGSCKKIYNGYIYKYIKEGLWEFYILGQGYEIRNYKNGKLTGFYEIKNLNGEIVYKKEKLKESCKSYFLKRLDFNGKLYKTIVVNGEFFYYSEKRDDLDDFDEYKY